MEKRKMTLYGTIFSICFFLIVTFFFSTRTVDYAVEQEKTSDTISTYLETAGQPVIEPKTTSSEEADTPVETIKAVDDEALNAYFKQVQGVLDKAAANFDGKLSVTYVDLTTGKQLSANGDKEYYSASTIKVPLAMMVADRVNEGVLKWSDQITFNKERDYEEGTGQLINDLKPAYSLKTLQEYNITYSDNIAKNMLYSLFGGSDQAKRQLYRYFFNREANVENTQFTSKDGAAILLKLYQTKETNSEYQKIYDYMKKTAFHERLETPLTTGKVAHKIGSYDESIHDIGILETSYPFILSVFTEGKSGGSEAISGLVDQIWTIQEKQYPVSAAEPQALLK